MEWLVALIAVGAVIWAAVRFPAVRIALGLAVLAAVAAYFYFTWQAERQEQYAESLIAKSDLMVSDVTLGRDQFSSGFYTLKGRLLNNSRHTFTGMTIAVYAYDCPSAGVELSGCLVIGQDSATVSVTVPPGQVRSFSGLIMFSDMPAIKGSFAWSYASSKIKGRD